MVLGSSMKQVFDALGFNQHLRVLDIRHQQLGFDLIPMLEDFFQHNKSVDEIFIDDNNLLDIQSFETLLAHLVTRNWKLTLHVPSKDVLSLFEMNNISASKAERLIRLLHQLKNCEETRPFSSTQIGSLGDDVGPDEIVYEIRDTYFEDDRWEESFNFAPVADEETHYAILEAEFSLDSLAQKLKTKH
jgi:hypothetical protein